MYLCHISPWLVLGTTATSSAAADRSALEAELAAALNAEQPQQTTSAPAVRLIDISIDLLGAAGGSSAPEAALRDLQAGGHDPKNNGFTVQNGELTLSGVVDPYFRGDANIVLQISEEGETIIELEELYLTTLSLPANLQVKAGQFFSAFGRLNPTHPHAWDFVDQPVVNSRFMGPDGLRAPGLQISWLTPLPFFLELTGSVQNSQGETAASFRSVPGETVAGRELMETSVDSPADLLYLARAKASFDLGEETTIVFGGSGAFGPNASAPDARTIIAGADLYAKWKPLANEAGWPFLALQSEAMMRRYDTIDDYGLYAQISWGFTRPWTAGIRYDYARGESLAFGMYDTTVDPFRTERHRAAAALTYYPSEFSKIRVQYNYDRSGALDSEDAHSVYLQAEIIWGAHGAHKF